MNMKNNNKTLLYDESIKLKTKINKLKKELALAKSYNHKKEEEIKKRERAIEKAKNKLRENNSFGNLKEENIIIKLKDNYQILKSKIKKQVEENNKLQNEIKQLNINDLEMENNYNLALLKDKIDEYNNNLQYNLDCNNELNSYTFNKREFYDNHLYIEKMQKIIEEKTKKVNSMKENLQTMKDKLFQIEENRKRIISYNDSIKKQNEKLLIDKKKREDFILKKPIILGKINEYEAKAKNFEDEYKNNENEIENISNERKKLTKQIKDSEISKPIDYDKLKCIEKNPKENIDQKILLLESLIKESKDRQNEFIEIFAYYDDYVHQKENYEMINNEAKLIEENNMYNNGQNNDNNFDNSPDNKKNKNEEEDNNEEDISVPFLPSSINSNNRDNLNHLNENNENKLLKVINKEKEKEKEKEQNNEEKDKNIQEIKEDNIKDEEKEEVNKNKDSKQKNDDTKNNELVNIYNESEENKNNKQINKNSGINTDQKNEDINKSQENKKNETDEKNTLKQNFEHNEDKEINELKKSNNDSSNNNLMNDKKEEKEINGGNKDKDTNNGDNGGKELNNIKEENSNEDKVNNENSEFNIINNDLSIDNKDIKNQNKESSNENNTNDNKERNKENKESNTGDNNEKKSEESNFNEKDKFIINNLNEKDRVDSKKKSEKKLKDFKLVFSLILTIKKISNEQIEEIISKHKAHLKEDKNTFILNLSKDILGAIKDNNDNDIKLLKKILIYLLEEKSGNDEELFFKNLTNDLVSKNKLTFSENEDEENKLLGKIIESYSTKSKSIIEKINKDNKNNKKNISYKNLKKYLKEENLYIKNNKEKIELFKFFMFVLKKNTTSSDENFSMFDFNVEDIINFFNGIFEIKNEKSKDNNINEGGLTITDEEFKKIIHTFLKNFKKFLTETNVTLSNLLGEENINIMIKDGKEIEVINIYKFVNILNEKGFNLDDNFILSCVFAKYQVDENLEDININILQDDLKNH